MNLRAASAHVLADAAGSAAAIVAAILILAFGWTIADPITSIAISGLILFGAWRLLRDAATCWWKGRPPGIDVVGAREAPRAGTSGRERRSRLPRLVDRGRRARHHGARRARAGGARRRGRARRLSSHRGVHRPRPCHRATRSDSSDHLLPVDALTRPRGGPKT